MQTAIDIRELSFSYKDAFHKGKSVLKKITISVEQGDTVGFLGANGAGKTTAIKILLGLLKPESGEVTILGEQAGSLAIRRKIGYLPERPCYYGYLTSEELLRMYAGLFGLDKKTADRRINYLLELVELDKCRKMFLKHYSKGMLHRIGLAQALINSPDILILDEPTSGLDPCGKMSVRRIINGFKNQGKTIFFSSHELSEVELICDKVAIINNGELICYILLREILDSVKSMYKEDIPNKLEKYFLKTITEVSD